MTNLIDLIINRRSVRAGFRSQPIDRRALERVVRAGLAAPSSKNARPWILHVVTSRLILDEVASCVETAEGKENYVPHDPATGAPRKEWSSTVSESAAVLREVPGAIFIENTGAFSRGRRTLTQAKPEALRGSIVGYTLEVLGIGAVLQNLWLAAEAQGLGAVFMGDVLIAEDHIRARLDIVGDLMGVLALGYIESRSGPSRQSDARELDSRVRWHV